MDVLFFGAVQRVVQSLAQAAPTILVGLLVAAVFRQLLGVGRTRQLFGIGTWRALPQAWLLGMLLPVCSLGVIPVAREMRRAGIAGGTVLAFALTAPLFNPLSLLYGLTLSDPLAIITFSLCSLGLVTAVGLVLERLTPQAGDVPAEDPATPVGWRRMAAMVTYGLRQTVPTIGYVIVALIGVVALAVVLPAGSLQTSMEYDNLFAPSNMALVAVPAYATPMLAMSQVGMMFSHANSIGAAFVLLVLGTGVNLGLVLWAVRSYSLREAMGWLVLVVSVVLAMAYAVNDPLHPHEIEPAGHTHAFDIYCCPMNDGQSSPAQHVAQSLGEALHWGDYVSLSLLAGLTAIGAGLRWFDPREQIEQWLRTSTAKMAEPRRYDLILPAPVVAGIALGSLLIFSVVGCYYYYPAPHNALAELTVINTEVASGAMSGNRKHAEYFLPLADDWTRRMQVGAYLRRGTVTRYQQMKARLYVEKLELLEHALADDTDKEVAEHAHEANLAFHRMKSAFSDARP